MKTYEKEMHLAIYCIKTIFKYCKTPFEVIVCLDSNAEIDSMKSLLGPQSFPVKWLSINDFGYEKRNGYIDQQCIKIESHRFCIGKYILHVDSDMIFFRDFCVDDFLYQNKAILPFGDWGRNKFLSNEQIRALQIYLKKDIFFLGDLEQELRELPVAELNILGYKEFISNRYTNVLIALDGFAYRWTTEYPDLLWIASSRIFGSHPFDTMKNHYLVDRNMLCELDGAIKTIYLSIWGLAYSRNDLPVFSEFQIIGNYILDKFYKDECNVYLPVPFQVLYTYESYISKMPVIKYNLKDHPVEKYAEILNGSYSSNKNKNELLRMLGPGWAG